jgi:AraC family transcriptional regulator
MQPRIEILAEKKLIGQRVRMSFSNNWTAVLWQSFMPRRKEIENSVGTALFSLEVYDSISFFADFTPLAEFDKWAAVEVANWGNIPADMEALLLPGGLYAVFIHQGLSSEGQKTYEYIFRDWLPRADFVLDDRPHFALMGEKYKNNDPNSEEEIWIPIQEKA